MMLHKKIKKDFTNYGQFVFKAVSFQYIILASVIMQILVVWMSKEGTLFPEIDDFLQLVGTCSEIIAGLYGITLAGYTFFLSRMDALMTTDMTLDYIIASVKNKFKFIIWYLTFNVAMTLFISIVLMYYPDLSNVIPEFFYRLICNEFVLFIGFSIVLILYHSLSVINPNCLEKEATKLQKKLSNSRQGMGSVVEFISLYDQIEMRCNEMLPNNVLSQIHGNKGKHFEHTIELLHEQYPLIRPLIGELNHIHRYYECMVNNSPMYVTQEMCALARKVLGFLEGMSKRQIPQK